MLMLYLCIILVFAGVSCKTSLKELNSDQNFTDRLGQVLKNNNGKISPECEAQLSQYWKSLSSGKKEDMWAKQMFDAAAKIPSGILEVPTAVFGSFDECLSIEARTKSYEIYGQYCLGTIPFPSELSKDEKHLLLRNDEGTGIVPPVEETGIQFATCFPNACSAVEIQEVYSDTGLGIVFYDQLCQTKNSKPELDAGSIATISFLGVVLCIMIASSAYDAFLHYLSKKTYHPMLIAFSVATNTKKILATSSGPNQISCLHGIRVITTMWVILVHRYTINSMLPVKSYPGMYKWMDDPANMYIMGAALAVDTFFLIGGMVISYSYMLAVTKGMKFNILMYYIHRYVRLTPVLAVIILIHVTLLKYFGSGPLLPHMIETVLVRDCKKSWWKALLYIQNYGNSELCIPQTWYLTVDMQLFLLSPIILIPLKRWPMYTLAGTGFLTVCSILSCFLTGWFFELNNNQFAIMDASKRGNFMKFYYTATHTRAAIWLIGIILGYIIFTLKQRKTKLRMNAFLVVAVWASSLAVLCTCLFAGQDLIFGEYNQLGNSLHIALVSPAWGVALALVIFACVMGYGVLGPINWFLSLPIFEVISKLTFTMYITHFTILFCISAQMRDVTRFGNNGLYVFWGDFAITLLISFILTLAFESPIVTIEKVLLGGRKKPEASPAAPLPKPHKEYVANVETA